MTTSNPIDPIAGGYGSDRQSFSNDLVHFIVSDISASGLKKIMFFQPDTYVKFKIGPCGTYAQPEDNQTSIQRSPTHPLSCSTLPLLPHQGQCHRTHVQEHSVDPKWVGEFFKFVAFRSDFLEIEVKDKVAKPSLSRILGRRKILLSTILPFK